MRRIVLISCVAQKRDRRSRVSDLYTSRLFTSSMDYAHSLKPDHIYVLSALHHLLELDTVIEPYDVTLSSVPLRKRKSGLIVLNAKQKREWGDRVVQQLAQKADLKQDRFIFLAGQEYIKPLKQYITHLENPLQRFFQGQRVSFMKNAVKSPHH